MIPTVFIVSPEAYTQEMIARVATLTLALIPALLAQATTRAKVSDYPAHTKLPSMEIGVEYLLNSIPLDKGMYLAKDHLILDVAIFPSSPAGVNVSTSQFTLRLNRKTILYPDSPGAVASSLKYPDWQTRPTMTAEAGAGNGSVILGAPPPVARFPGDRRADRPASVPRVPEPPNPTGEPKPVEQPIDTQLAIAALPEGPSEKPVKGLLFFAFSGKTKSIRSLDLIYEGGEGSSKAIIPLF
jgi:hypothetical protein